MSDKIEEIQNKEFKEALTWSEDCVKAGVARLDKELATAKAENARLASALKGLQWPTKGGDSKVSLAKAESDADQALSSSNALDYWQGEIRKARAEAKAEALKNAGDCDGCCKPLDDAFCQGCVDKDVKEAFDFALKMIDAMCDCGGEGCSPCASGRAIRRSFKFRMSSHKPIEAGKTHE